MPDFLDEIVSQDHAKQLIRTALTKGGLYNLLFTGPRGVGKRMTAFALAKTIGSPPGSPEFFLIGPIPSAIKEKQDKIAEYIKRYMPDQPVIDIDDRTNIIISQVRDLIGDLSILPTAGRRRFVLILYADMMTEEAANCFLKTLEEPPVDTIFALTTARVDFVLPTIRSRCQIVNFSHLTLSAMQSVLFETNDDFRLNSPGEIMVLRDNPLLEQSIEVFRKTPLSIADAAELAREFSRKKIIDLLYPLLLLYRLLLYRNLAIPCESAYDALVVRKTKHTPLASTIDALAMLNTGIVSLKQNPNHLLLLFNLLLKLP